MQHHRRTTSPGDHEERTGGLAVAPSMDPALASVRVPREEPVIGARTVRFAGIAMLIGIAGGFIAEALLRLIGLITNLVFFQRIDTTLVPPTTEHLGVWVIAVPILGAVVIGLMARFGSPAIRGHGIPEVMEKVLRGESRIPLRLMFLKPLSAAIAIGTGGRFGAEGPIIATGGALGSLVGQVLWISATERKTLLAAGAAAGMAATFGSPLSAVLLAIELLLFEFRARSLIPVALATTIAACLHLAFHGTDPMFPLNDVAATNAAALGAYIIIGAIVGTAAIGVTKLVYYIEELFARLPIHWMWWLAIGGIAVGIVGYFSPRT